MHKLSIHPKGCSTASAIKSANKNQNDLSFFTHDIGKDEKFNEMPK